jgi:hypothetical protein
LYAIPNLGRSYHQQLNPKTIEFIKGKIHLIMTDRFDIEKGNGTLFKIAVSRQWIDFISNGKPYWPNLVGPHEGWMWLTGVMYTDWVDFWIG